MLKLIADLPAEVIEYKNFVLEQPSSDFNKIFLKLIGEIPNHDDPQNLAEIVTKMWRALYKFEQTFENKNKLDYGWIVKFIFAIEMHSKLPEYYAFDENAKKKLIESIEKETKKLIGIYKRFKLDETFLEPNFITNTDIGFYLINKKPDESFDGLKPKSFSDLMQLFAYKCRLKIGKSSKAKKTKNQNAIMLVRHLSTEYLPRKIPYSVLRGAAYAMYDKRYEDSELNELLLRKKKKK